MIRARDVDVGSRAASGGITGNVDPSHLAHVQWLSVVAADPVDLNVVTITLQIVDDGAGRSAGSGDRRNCNSCSRGEHQRHEMPRLKSHWTLQTTGTCGPMLRTDSPALHVEMRAPRTWRGYHHWRRSAVGEPGVVLPRCSSRVRGRCQLRRFFRRGGGMDGPDSGA